MKDITTEKDFEISRDNTKKDNHNEGSISKTEKFHVPLVLYCLYDPWDKCFTAQSSLIIDILNN